MALALQDIPISVKDHFGSERTSNLLREVSRKAQIVSPGLIPGAIYSLISKDVTAHDFIESLSEDFGLSKTRALAVAKEIKERVLEPVRRDLFRWGIDISAIDVRNAPDLESLRIEEPEEKTGVKIPLVSFGERTSVAVPITPGIPEKPVIDSGSPLGPGPLDGEPLGAEGSVVGDGPLILHTERETKPIIKEEGKKFRAFSFGLGFLGKKKEMEPKPSIIARLEIPKENKEEKKTVNYSEYRTPITPLGNPVSAAPFIANKEKIDKELLPVTNPPAGIGANPPTKPRTNAVEPNTAGPSTELGTGSSTGLAINKAEQKKKFFWFGAGDQTANAGANKEIKIENNRNQQAPRLGSERVPDKIQGKPLDIAQDKPAIPVAVPSKPPATKIPIVTQEKESGSRKKFFWFKKETSAETPQKENKQAPVTTTTNAPEAQPPKSPAAGPILEGNKVDLRSATNGSTIPSSPSRDN